MSADADAWPLRGVSVSRSWRSALLLALCVTLGAAATIVRAAYWDGSATPVYRGFCAPPAVAALERWQWQPGYCRIELARDGWRPLRVQIALRASSDAATTPIPVRLGADDRDIATVQAGPAWTPHTIFITTPPAASRTLALQISVQPDADGRAPIDVGRIDTAPIVTPLTAWKPALAGALLGALIWIALAVRVRGAPDPIAAMPPTPRAVTAAVFAALLLYLGFWAVLRPPFQTPDEVQHHLRATAVLRHPWMTSTGTWTLDPRVLNPLTLWPTPGLQRLFFNPNAQVTPADIDIAKRTDWLAPEALPAPDTYARAIASYPALYYVAVFAVAEPLTQGLHLTPYASTFAYRFVTVLFAALLWTIVFARLRAVPETRPAAGALLALFVLPPMTAFMSSGINPDAVNIPLCALAVLAAWRTLMTGRGAWTTSAFLVLAALTKPAGLQAIGALGAASAALWLWRACTFDRVMLTGLALLRAALIAWFTFYLWSPPTFFTGPPSDDRLTLFLATRWQHLYEIWIQFWGWLGWLDYHADPRWYHVMLAAVLLNAVCAIWKPVRPVWFAAFTAIFVAAFAASTLAGEFLYLKTAGYILQGRYLLPASIGLSALLLHRVRAARWTLLAAIVLLDVLLIQQTVTRYYAGDWSRVYAALPFTASGPR